MTVKSALDEYIKKYGICPIEASEKEIYKIGLGYFIEGWDARAAQPPAQEIPPLVDFLLNPKDGE